MDFKKISDEMIAHLAREGVVLNVRVEIEAVAAEGFDQATMRRLSENATTLKFDDATFEES